MADRPPLEDPLVKAAAKAIAKHRLIEPGEHVLVAVSGGADSIALLHILQILSTVLKFQLSAAHLNHCIREEDETQGDRKLIEELCSKMSIHLTCEVSDIPKIAAQGKKSLEEAGRAVRLDFLESVALAESAHRIATGHHADDQAETVLMRIVRGTGLLGLGGIRWQREKFIRPLLGCTRQEIRQFLERYSLRWREDSTNSNLVHLRNRIRAEWLPLLSEENPRVVGALSSIAEQARAGETALEQLADECWQHACVNRKSWRIVLDLPTLMNYHLEIQRRVIRMSWRVLAGREADPLSVKETARLMATLSGCSYVVGRGRFRAQSTGRRWTITTDRAPTSLPPTKLPNSGLTQLQSCRLKTWVVEGQEGCKLAENGWPGLSVLDMSRLQGPLSARTWQSGDALHNNGGKYLVARLLREQGIPRIDRPWTVVFTDESGLVMVAGVGVDERVAVTDGTKRALVVQCV